MQVNVVTALWTLQVNGGQNDNGVMVSNYLTCVRVLIASPILDFVHVRFLSYLHLDTRTRTCDCRPEIPQSGSQ